MQSQISEVAIIVIAGTVLVLFLLLFLVSFFYIFQKRQLQNRQEKTILQAQFSQEILKSQVEVQNSTMQQIGQELHDNIGQLLSVAKIYLNILEGTKQKDEDKEYIKLTNEIVGQSIHDLRALTKSLDGDFVEQFGLQESISHELQRIRKTRKFQTEISILGEQYPLGFDIEIILFRITQEVLNNALKHSEAQNINVRIHYTADNFLLCIYDDGKGFNFDRVNTGILHNSGAGVRNIQRRTELIGGEFEIETGVDKGTKIEIRLPKPSITTDSSQT